LVDRQQDLATRLMTLHGTAGLGKTRLASQYLLDHCDEYAGGAWFCDLTYAVTADDVLGVVMGVLGVQPGAHEGPRCSSSVDFSHWRTAAPRYVGLGTPDGGGLDVFRKRGKRLLKLLASCSFENAEDCLRYV
jgi:hypothetical protein